MTSSVKITQALGGYIVECYPDSQAVFTDFPDLIDWLMRHFNEDRKKAE